MQRAIAWRRALTAGPKALADAAIVIGTGRESSIDDGRWIDDTVSKLARALVLPGEVPVRCTAVTVQGDDERWTALHRVLERYEQVLTAAGLCDPRLDELRRLRAPAGIATDAPERIVLVGVLELDRAARAALELFEHAQRSSPSLSETGWELGAGGTESESPWSSRRVVVVSAGDSEGLDGYGTISPDRPSDESALRAIAIADAQLTWSGGPPEAAALTIDTIAAWHGDGAIPTSRDVVICSPDPSFTSELGIAAAGVTGFAIHDAAGVALSATGVGRVVQAIAGYVRRGDRLSLATLVKHGAVQRALDAAGDGTIKPDWLRFVDAEATESPRSQVGKAEQDGGGECESVAGVLHSLVDLEEAGLRPLRDQVVRLGTALGVLLSDSLDSETTKSLAAAITEVGGCDAVLPERVSLADAADLLLEGLAAATRAADGVAGAVDVVGWLDAAYDPAPNLVLLGFNSGIMPARPGSDAWLNETVLRALGMFTSEHAAARDAYLLRHMLESRREHGRVCAIIASSDADGATLWPSPFAFACDDAAALRRAERMSRGERAVAKAKAERLEVSREADAAAFPTAPVVARKPVEAISVTAFKDYIASPYVFYVTHALRLREAGEPDRESGYDRLGTLTHELLRDFAGSRLRNSESAEQIEAWLLERFEERAGSWPKSLLASTAELQQTVLKRRLTRFALLQARHRREGWQISATEWEPSEPVMLQTSRGDVRLKGRIDRIDRRGGAVMVLDYKTSDRKKKPADAFKKGRNDQPNKWLDLQLPLYRYMLMRSGFDAGGRVDAQSAWTLGYWPLCKDREGPEIVTLPVGTEDLAAAERKAIEIVEAVLSGAFAELGDPADYGGSISRLCGLRLLEAEEEEGET
jgi:RecB family exonuclease